MVSPAPNVTLEARAVGACWGFDTTARLNAVRCAGIKAAVLPGGYPCAFVLRYVSLGAPNLIYDIGPSERDDIALSGLAFGLVQHVEYPSWRADAQVGAQHGKAAAMHARLVGYPAGADLFVDMEGVGNPGSDAETYLAEWLKPVQDAGFNTSGGCQYEGYDNGILTMPRRMVLYQKGIVRKVWSDFGHREPLPGVGFVCVQHPSVMFAGIEIDPDEARIALDGAQMMLAGLAGDPHIENPPDPVTAGTQV